MNNTEIAVREIEPADHAWVRSFLGQHFGSTKVVLDNEPAIAFYSRWGMHLAAVHRGAIAESRRLKPEISYFGVGGRPIEDEIEFGLLLE